MEATARVIRVRQETPTVKSFLLALGETFTFLPGQWIDLYVDPPGEQPTVGGFTIVSSPTVRGTIELAIKEAGGGHAALYLHGHAKVGDDFRVVGPGGEFHFRAGMSRALFLIAGGIGINPLMSIVRYVDALGLDVQTTLLYSATTPSEILFREELQTIAARNPRLHCVFTVTRPEDEPWEGRTGRIDRALLRQTLPPGDALYYLCGPPGMPTEIANLLQRLGIPHSRIRFEEW